MSSHFSQIGQLTTSVNISLPVYTICSPQEPLEPYLCDILHMAMSYELILQSAEWFDFRKWFTYLLCGSEEVKLPRMDTWLLITLKCIVCPHRRLPTSDIKHDGKCSKTPHFKTIYHMYRHVISCNMATLCVITFICLLYKRQHS